MMNGLMPSAQDGRGKILFFGWNVHLDKLN